MKKQLLLLVMMLLPMVAMQTYGQGFPYDYKTVKKMALECRDDISPDVLDKIKQWEETPIIHSDWIENPKGKSLWLDGTEIFPNINYTKLYVRYPNMFEVRNGSYVGLFYKDGSTIAPMKYSDLHIGSNGYVTCLGHPSWDGKLYHHSIDYYKIDGQFVYHLEYTNPKEYSFPVTVYEEKENILKVIITKQCSSKNCLYEYRLLYPDGQEVIEPIEGKETLTVKNGVIRFGKKEIPIPNFSPMNHPGLGVDTEGLSLLISNTYKENYYIKKAVDFYNSKKWNEALTYLNFFHQFENLNLWNSVEAKVFCLMWLRCKYELGQSEEIYKLIKDKNVLRPYQLEYSPSSHSLSDGSIRPLSNPSEELKEVSRQCKELFDIAVAPYVQQEIKQENEKQLQKQQMWIALFGAITSSINNYLTYSSTTSSYTNNSVNIKTAPTSSTTNSTSERTDGGELVTQEKHTPCQVCNGTGKCTHCNGTGRGKRLGMDVTCGACSGHPTCTSCKGKGYKISYENVRK